MKVEFLCDTNLSALEYAVNKFLDDKILHDIKFSSCWDEKDKMMEYSVAILYKT